MPVRDFGTVRCYLDPDGVDVSFARGDEATKAKVKELKGRWNPIHRRWRIETQYSRKDPDTIANEIEKSLEAAAPDWWPGHLAALSAIACVTRKYALKIGIGGMRIDLPAGHPSDYVFETVVPSATRDGRSWMVPPENFIVPGKPKEKSPTVLVIERVLKEDKGIFADAAKFIGQRRIAGIVVADEKEIERLGLVAGKLVAADTSFFEKADPEMPVNELQEWCLFVESMQPAQAGYAVMLRYAPLGDAFAFLRARRAASSPSPSLGALHAVAKWEKIRAK